VSLLVSLHDVAPPHLRVLRRLRDELERWGVARATLLVVPEYHGVPLEGSPETLAWLRARVAAGDEVALHGCVHRQRGRIPRWRDRVRARLFTAGEGECLAQSDGEREAMLIEGKRRLEQVYGRPVRGFVAPAWLEPAGFGAHLAAAGFRWHEGSGWLEHRPPPVTGTGWRRQRGPVIGFATRSRARLLASLAWARLVAPAAAGLARRGGIPARVAFHPADAGSAAVTRQLERVVRRLAAALPARTYAETLLFEA
jgi:uncharacterized protein